jgi:hypothetical protein
MIIDLGKLAVGQYSNGIPNNKFVAAGNFYFSFGLISITKGQLRPDISYWHAVGN